MAPPERIPAAAGSGPAGAVRSGGVGAWLRLAAALLLLGLGGSLGWQARTLLLQRPVTDDPAAAPTQRRQALLASGWKEVDSGVFARPCQSPCRPPRIYGGGAAAAPP